MTMFLLYMKCGGSEHEILRNLRSAMNLLIKTRSECKDQRAGSLLDEAFEYMINAEYELALLCEELPTSG